MRYQTTHFDPFGEWPVRMGVVVDAARPTHVVLMYYHVLVDGFGIDAIVRDLANLADPAAPVQGVRPLELAARQREPAARKQSEKALRHWERQLDRVPPCPHPEPVDPGLGEPRHWEVVCESRALALAVRTVAARTGLASGPILLAAYATALARVTGHPAAAVQIVVSNRFRPGFAEAVTSLRQFGLCVLDTGVAFDEAVARSWAAMLAAFKHGYFDGAAAPRDLEAWSCYLNDRRRGADDPGGEPPTAEAIRAAQAKSTVHLGVREETYDGTFYLHIEDEPGRISYTLWGDTHRYTPEAIERCARDLEAIVIEAALSPATVGT